MRAEALEAPQRVAIQLDADHAQYATLGRTLRDKAPTICATLARGSSDHAASYLAYLLMSRYGQWVTSLPMSLLTLHQAPLALRQTLAIAVSQSGRSPDLLKSMAMFRDAGAASLAFLNRIDSPLADRVDTTIDLHAGPEGSVAATKSFICSLSACARLCAAWHQDAPLASALSELPDALQAATRQDWSAAVEVLAPADNMMVIGRGLGLSIAQEAALKFKETSGLQAAVFSGAEVQHGPMALVRQDYPMLILAPRGPAQADLLRLSQQMRGLGARVLLAASDDVPARELTLTSTSCEALNPMAAIQSFYLLAEAVAQARGCNPDQPPHLKKVTSTL